MYNEKSRRSIYPSTARKLEVRAFRKLSRKRNNIEIEIINPE